MSGQELNTNQEPQEAQDLHIQQPAPADQNWARMQPMFIQPSKERLARLHQLVSIKNTSDATVTAIGRPQPQKHIVIDRYNQGHELQPGQTKNDIDMLVDDIEYFIRERTPNRMDHQGRHKPIHPIQIIGFNDKHLPERATSQPQGQVEKNQKSDKQEAGKQETTRDRPGRIE